MFTRDVAAGATWEPLETKGLLTTDVRQYGSQGMNFHDVFANNH